MLDKPIHFQLRESASFSFSLLWGHKAVLKTETENLIREVGWEFSANVLGNSTVDGETKIWREKPTTWHVFQKLVKPCKSWDNFTISTGAIGFCFPSTVWSCDHDPFELVQVEFYTKRWILHQKMESIFDQVSKKHLELQHLWMLNVTLKIPCEVVFKFRKLLEHLNSMTHVSRIH